MKKLLLSLFCVFGFLDSYYAQVNQSSTYVNGYYRKDGTYVQGHYRTTPNSTINDNYSTYPNVNPHTGKVGTVSPNYGYNIQSVPQYNNNSYTPLYSSPSYNSTPTYSYPTYSTPQYYNYGR